LKKLVQPNSMTNAINSQTSFEFIIKPQKPILSFMDDNDFDPVSLKRDSYVKST